MISRLLVGLLFFGPYMAEAADSGGEEMNCTFSKNYGKEEPLMNPSDLCELTGSPFNSSTENAFHIHDTNIHGESVGVAALYCEKLGGKWVAWYWSPETGFDVIASREIFENHRNYFAEFQLQSVYFRGLRINDNGVIACGVEFRRQGWSPEDQKFSWFWWSKNEGLHLSGFHEEVLSVHDIDNFGNVLLLDDKVGSLAINNYALISNIRDMRCFDKLFYKTQEINEAIKKRVVEYCVSHNLDGDGMLRGAMYSHPDKLRLVYDVSGWRPAMRVDTLLENGGVHGTGGGACRLVYEPYEGIEKRSWPKRGIISRVVISFEFMSDGEALKIKVKKIYSR